MSIFHLKTKQKNIAFQANDLLINAKNHHTKQQH